MTVSASARLNAVFAFFVTVVFTVLGLTAVTGPIMLSQAETSSALNVASVSVKTGRIGYYYDYTKPLSELGTITFDLEAGME
ncbi:hypothetical protein HK101_006239 [Irineochytrium annulatum]|nr:hypothetical protein HK101_006239 [Irineochytrium annulatum]